MRLNYRVKDKSPYQPNQMQFKIDENLPIELAELLVAAGYDAKTVNDEQLQGGKDKILIVKCAEEKRILITLDTDFSNIKAYPPEESQGIIVLRVSTHSKKHILEVFRKTIKSLQKEPVKQNLWIVEEARIRIRGKN